MQGIVSLLDAASEEVVRSLWAKLARGWGLREGPRSAPVPHISYHVAEEYDLARVGPLMRCVAADAAPLSVRITGVQAFTEAEPVMYLAVERSAELLALHTAIWNAIEDAGIAHDTWKVYAPEYWVPHVTLAMGDLTRETLEEIVSAWSGRDMRRTVRVSAISFFGEASYTPIEQVQLSGPGGALF